MAGSAESRADGDAQVVARHVVELVRLGGVGDDGPRVSALHAVDEVTGADRRRRRHDDGAELHDAEHRLPQLDLVAEHEHDRSRPCATPSARARPRPGRSVGPSRRSDTVRTDSSCSTIVRAGLVVAASDGVEPVDRPVPALADVGEGELGHGALVVLTEVHEKVPRRAESVGHGYVGGGTRCHGPTLPEPADPVTGGSET